MDIIKLKSFMVLAEEKSFSETAEVLFLSQPAVSKHIQSLEEELGVRLFNRNRNNISLTVHGEYFLPYASEIIRLSERSKEHLMQLEDLNEGCLHFGATNFIGVYLMPQLIKQFKDHYPDININMNITSSRKLFQKFENHELEFAFVSHYVQLDDNKYRSDFFTKDHMALIVPAEHHLAQANSCFVSDILHETFIMKNETSSLSRFLLSKFENDSFKNCLIVSSQEAIKQTVMEGLGVTIMSTRAVQTEVKAGLLKIVELEDMNLDRDIHLITHKKFSLTPAAQAFFDVIGIEMK